MMISFNVSREDAEIIQDIAERAHRAALSMKIDYPLIDAVMDITATHANAVSLKLAELAVADDFTFNHDVFGIRRHLDRSTGSLLNCFVPRLAVVR